MANNIIREDREALIKFLAEPENKLTHGEKTVEFERKWASWLGVKYAVFVNSGASANDISMLIIKELFGEGEVIVPPLTWVSDVASVVHANHTPIFSDINIKNLALDSASLRKVITSRTKAIFLTHILGLNGLNDEILELAEENGIALVEDVCESHGASWRGKKLGTFGLLSNFSFYYAHHLTTIEGGMICTDSEEVYQLARMFRSHGLVRESSNIRFRDQIAYEYQDLNPEFIFYRIGHNMRPTEISAVLGLSQLPRLDKNIELRNRNFVYFLEKLDPKRYVTEFDIEGCSNYALILILRESNLSLRDKIERILVSNRVEFRRGLSGGGNQTRQPYISNIGLNINPTDFPITERAHHFGWYIGNFPELEVERIDILCGLLNSL